MDADDPLRDAAKRVPKESDEEDAAVGGVPIAAAMGAGAARGGARVGAGCSGGVASPKVAASPKM